MVGEKSGGWLRWLRWVPSYCVNFIHVFLVEYGLYNFVISSKKSMSFLKYNLKFSQPSGSKQHV